MMFKTIRETVAMAECPISENMLRALVKAGTCPGFYAGSRFYVRVDKLQEVLDGMSNPRVTTQGSEVVNHG